MNINDAVDKTTVMETNETETKNASGTVSRKDLLKAGAAGAIGLGAAATLGKWAWPRPRRRRYVTRAPQEIT